MSYRLYLVEDHPVMREAYAGLLAGHDDLDLCGQLETAEQALRVLEDHPCDLVVSDVGLPGMSGLDLLRRIRKRWPTLPVLILTGQEDAKTERLAHEAGAAAFVHKSKATTQLIGTIRHVLAQGAD